MEKVRWPENSIDCFDEEESPIRLRNEMIEGISNFGKTIEIKRKRESEFVCFQNGDPQTKKKEWGSAC